MGHIKLYRKIQQWEWYGKPNMVALWIHLLLNANWEDNEWRGLTIKRGQLVTSINAIAVETGLSVSQVRSGLKNLQNSKQITCETTNQMTKVTICNYESYQSFDDSESQTKRKRNSKQISNPTSPEIATNKEDNNIRKEEPLSCVAERIYQCYPASTIRDNGSPASLRSTADKKKIETLLRNGKTEEELTATIKRYLAETNPIYYRMLSTFLNNIPDYSAPQLPLDSQPEPQVFEYAGMRLSKAEYDAIVAGQRIIKGE